MLIGVIDTETTGTDVTEDRICEIALLVLDSETGAERMRYERRINPERRIPPGAVAIHGITDADVMGCPVFKDIAPTFAKLLERLDVLVGHNIEGFDAMILLYELNRAGVAINKSPVIFDTMLKGRFACADGKIPNLSELCWALDVEYDTTRAHAAMYDVEVTAQAFLAGVKMGVFQVVKQEEVQ